MRRVVLLCLALFVLALIFVPDTSDPWDRAGNPSPASRGTELSNMWQVFQKLATVTRDALYLLAELTLDLLNKAWQATPSRFKVVYGVSFAGTGFLAFVGLWSILTLSRLPG